MRPGPGHADEQQPPFLGLVVIRAGRRAVTRSARRAGQPEGQQAFLAAGHEHHRELQALGRVQGQQGDRVGAGIESVRLGPQ